jgi:hypothetical protein
MNESGQSGFIGCINHDHRGGYLNATRGYYNAECSSKIEAMTRIPSSASSSFKPA